MAMRDGNWKLETRKQKKRSGEKRERQGRERNKAKRDSSHSQANPFTGVKRGRESRPAPFGMRAGEGGSAEKGN